MRLITCLLTLSLLTTNVTLAQIQVINSPPTPIPTFFNIPSNTTLNILPGADVGSFVNAGNEDGTSTNIVVNISGGDFGSGFDFFSGTTVNSTDGQPTGAVGSPTAHTGSVVNISGGDFGPFFTVAGGTVNLFDGGEISSGFEVEDGGVVNIFGGIVGPNFDARNGSTVKVTGGNLWDLDANTGSNVDFSGGSTFLGLRVDGGNMNFSGGFARTGIEFGNSGGDLTISGGSWGSTFEMRRGGNVTLIGERFVLDGMDITSTFTGSRLVSERDVTLTGILADGTPFDLDLNTVQAFDADWFGPGSVVTIQRVPEPGALGLLTIGGLFLTCLGRTRRRRRS